MCKHVAPVHNTKLSARTTPDELTALTTHTHACTQLMHKHIYVHTALLHWAWASLLPGNRFRGRGIRNKYVLINHMEAHAVENKAQKKQFRLNKQTWLIGSGLQACWRERYALTLHTKIFTPYRLVLLDSGQMDGGIQKWRGWLERINKSEEKIGGRDVLRKMWMKKKGPESCPSVQTERLLSFYKGQSCQRHSTKAV